MSGGVCVSKRDLSIGPQRLVEQPQSEAAYLLKPVTLSFGNNFPCLPLGFILQDKLRREHDGPSQCDPEGEGAPSASGGPGLAAQLPHPLRGHHCVDRGSSPIGRGEPWVGGSCLNRTE